MSMRVLVLVLEKEKGLVEKGSVKEKGKGLLKEGK